MHYKTPSALKMVKSLLLVHLRHACSRYESCATGFDGVHNVLG